MKTNIEETESNANRQNYVVNEKQNKSRKIKWKDQLEPNGPIGLSSSSCPVGSCKICVFVFVFLTLVNNPFILDMTHLTHSFLPAYLIAHQSPSHTLHLTSVISALGYSVLPRVDSPLESAYILLFPSFVTLRQCSTWGK